jgi:hypothetical protein
MKKYLPYLVVAIVVYAAHDQIAKLPGVSKIPTL